MKSAIKELVRDAIGKRYPGSSFIDFDLDEPPAGVEADLSSNAAFALSRFAAAPPRELACALAEQIQHGNWIEKIEVSENGFLNFNLRNDSMRKILLKICAEKENFGKDLPKNSKNVLIEFVSANPTGPLHIGHGRGAALGDSLSRIFRQRGYKVQTEYYVNNMGIQMEILSESVKAKFFHLAGQTDVPFPKNGYLGPYIEEIAKEMADKNQRDFSRFPREYLLETIRKDLEQFGVHFDSWFYESSLYENKKIEEALRLLEEKNCLKQKEGALWFAGSPLLKHEGSEFEQERVLRKSDGKYTYFASDIAYHKNKFERGLGRCINVWGHDHHGYVPRILSAVSTLGFPRDWLKIVLYQLVSLKRGGKRVAMSTRSGEFVSLREVLDEVGLDACRFFFAMRSPSSQLEFDLDLAKKKSNENPVYYVQYVHARICSIFREAEKRGIKIEEPASNDVIARSVATSLSLFHLRNGTVPDGTKQSALSEPEEKKLMKKLCLFEDTLETAIQICSPHLLTEYLLDCATRFHRFYDKHRVLDSEPKIRETRLLLLQATQIVVKLGLSLLGVSAPERM